MRRIEAFYLRRRGMRRIEVSQDLRRKVDHEAHSAPLLR